MDVLTPEQRRRCMAAVSGSNTKPELSLRRALHALGFRYRLHDRSLPGRPDLALPGKHTVIFVHGCFWHRHTCKAGRSRPATRASFWREKLSKNVERDRRNRAAIRRMGWNVIEVWECQLKGAAIKKSIKRVAQSLLEQPEQSGNTRRAWKPRRSRPPRHANAARRPTRRPPRAKATPRAQ